MTDLYKIKPLHFEPAPECRRETWSAGSYVIKRYDAPEQWFVTFYGRRVDECGSLEMAFEAARKHHLERITRYLEPGRLRGWRSGGRTWKTRRGMVQVSSPEDGLKTSTARPGGKST